MKTLILSSVLILSLTGCASNCQKACVFGIGPGNSAFDSYAKYADSQDPCQNKIKPEFCGAGLYGKTTIYNQYGKTVGYIK